MSSPEDKTEEPQKNEESGCSRSADDSSGRDADEPPAQPPRTGEAEESRSGIFDRLKKRPFEAAALCAAAAAAACAAFYGSLAWREVPFSEGIDHAEVFVDEGDSAKRITEKLCEAGLDVSYLQMRLASRLHDKGMGGIHAGLYRFERGESLFGILDVFSKGALVDKSVRIPDGATIWEVKRIFADADNLKNTLAHADEYELMKTLGLDGYSSLEGFVSPDTYRYGSGTKDVSVLKDAVARQLAALDEEWNARDPSVQLKTPYEALILASIIEKETGVRSDRHLVSSVFHNRLRIGMPLQTDPTVIYGNGPQWNGRLTKKDLQTYTPYNTYRIGGLPPTPIAMPTRASIEAALHPADTKYLYFVSRGDGTSEFSTNLADHNEAVRRYIINKNRQPDGSAETSMKE